MMIMKMIKGFTMLVFIGYLFLWVVTPTYVFRQKWLLRVRVHTASTYFGSQGTTMLLFTMPVLFMAVIASVYLHLKKKSNKNHDEGEKEIETNDNITIWRRPMIIKGLGIVSKIELAFFVMFIALVVWSFVTYLHVNFATITHASAAKKGEEVWQSKLDSVALRFGLIGNLCLAFLFFPVTRGSSILSLFGLTSEASVKYHIWLGHIAMTLFSSHGVCYIIYWIVTKQPYEMLKWDKTHVSNVAGELALVAGLVMWATTMPKTRRKMFELFFYAHHLYIPFIVFFVFHVGIAYASIMLPGFYLFMIDRFLRFLQSRGNVRLVSTRVLPCETLELNFSSQGLSYTPTSILFINVPSISKAQWHPFTVSSSSNLEPEKLSVMIKGEGSWSKKLYQILSSPNPVNRLDVSIEGPYGPVSTNFLRHDMLVMVSGGSGITPFISIVRELVFTTETIKRKAPKILLISVFKDSSDLTMLELLLPTTGAPINFSKLEVQIEAYVTRETQPTTNEKKPVTTVWLKPSPSDSPITPILGQNGWLWLGAIISSSFVLFLLSMGLLNQYYIYPIDKNTNKIYSQASRCALNMLLICASIMVASSVGFWWNKKTNAMDSKQIQNMEGVTPNTSPNSAFYNVDRELESVPQQSLFQSTNVHYGERPDLKRILFEQKESSIGVLVCGPKKMRHEVANICSSGLASNLHFESISFSW